MKTIVLTGMSGVGKTTAASALANKLGYSFTDIDKLIEKKEQMSIVDIFALKGEPYFRSLEEALIKKIPLTNTVVALGGGAFENNNSRNFLLDNCLVIYLKAQPQTIIDRLYDDDTRPLLRGILNVNALAIRINQRALNYRKAHYTVDTDNKSADTVVKELYDICKH